MCTFSLFSYVLDICKVGMADIKFFSENPGNEIFSEDEEESCSFTQNSQSNLSASSGEIALKRRKLTRGKQKIPISFIQDRVRRCSTFSKRKTGLMKKAFELAELTGAEVLLLVASETNHVYTFTTNRLKAIIDSDQGRELIQSCLSSRNGQTATSSPPSQPPVSPQPELPVGQSRDEEGRSDDSGTRSELTATPQTFSIQMIDGTLLQLPVTFPGSSLMLPILPSNEEPSPLCLTVSGGENHSQPSVTSGKNPVV